MEREAGFVEAADFSAALEALVRIDPLLRPVIAATGPLPARSGRPGFEGLAYTVVAQLVSRQSAEAIWTRLVARTGAFTPESYLAIAGGEGPRLGLTAAKADTLVRVAEAIGSGALDLDHLARLPAKEAIRMLTRIKGIGLWTAEVHLLFNAGHQDIFPAGDLALRVAVGAAMDLGPRPDPAALRHFALRWAPHRSVAARLFWAFYGLVLRPGAPLVP